MSAIFMPKFPPPTLMPGPYVTAGIRISLKQLMSRHMLENGGDAGLGVPPSTAWWARVMAEANGLDLFGIGLERGPVRVELDLAAEPRSGHEPTQIFPDVERVLHGRDPDVEVDRTLLDGLGDLVRDAAADGADVDPGDDHAARAFVAVPLLVLVGPLLDALDQRRHADDGVRALLDGRRPRDVGRVDRQVVAEDRDLEERLAGPDADDAEVGAFRHQRVVSHAAVGDGEARPRLLGQIGRRLELID